LELNLTIHPFELTAQFGSLNDADKGIGAAFIFAMVLSFIPASMITFTVKERNEQIKHQ
jgi:ATP-binding cassette subfamily A (ABC1) protein 3